MTEGSDDFSVINLNDAIQNLCTSSSLSKMNGLLWQCVLADKCEMFHLFDIKTIGHTFLHGVQSVNAINELIRLGADVNALCGSGYYPIHGARNFDHCIALVKHGANVNQLDRCSHMPLYHFVLCWEEPDICRFIEECNPILKVEPFFPPTLKDFIRVEIPKRVAKCTQVIVAIIECNSFVEKQVSVLIGKMVWQYRRNKMWE